MTLLQLVGGVLISISLFGIYKVYQSMVNRKAALRDPVTRKATVIHLDDSDNEGDQTYLYVPTVEYTDENGKVYQRKLSPVKNAKAFQVGKKVNIICERNNPQNCIEPGSIGSDKTSDWVAMVFLFPVFIIGVALAMSQIIFVETPHEKTIPVEKSRK